LPVLVEEQLVEAASEIVGVLRVAPGGDAVVVAVDLRGRPVGDFAHPALGPEVLFVLARAEGGDEQDQVADVVRRFYHQPAAHIGLARADLRIAGDMVAGLGMRQPQADRFIRARSIFVGLAVVIGDDEPTLADQAGEHLVE